MYKLPLRTISLPAHSGFCRVCIIRRAVLDFGVDFSIDDVSWTKQIDGVWTDTTAGDQPSLLPPSMVVHPWVQFSNTVDPARRASRLRVAPVLSLQTRGLGPRISSGYWNIQELVICPPGWRSSIAQLETSLIGTFQCRYRRSNNHVW